MTSARRKILIIGSLPPFRTAAAALGLHLTDLLCDQYDIQFVIDDLAPPVPGDLAFPIMRLNDLKQEWETFEDHVRLYVVGEEGDSLFALDLLAQLPGLVIPASQTLFPLVESICKLRGGWPDNYWQWLANACGPAAEPLYTARIHDRRYSETQKLETPAFDILLEGASGVIAASPSSKVSLKASGIDPILTLPQLPGPVTSTTEPDQNTILYVCEQALTARYIQYNMSLYPALKQIRHQTVHPASRHLTAAIEAADTVVILDREHDSTSTALATALAQGKAIVTAGQAWASHLPTDSHLAIAHSKAFDTLAVTLGALYTVPGLQQSLQEAANAFHAQQGKAAWEGLTQCINATEIADGSPGGPAASKPAEPETTPTAAPLPTKLETAALIGAVPPPAILRAILPYLDLGRCPRFATAELAQRLVSITKDHPAKLLGKMGYEAPLIQCTQPELPSHRAPVPLADILHGLHAEHGITFACDVDGAIPGRELLHGVTSAPRLHFRIAFDETDRRAADHGYLGESGLFWHHDNVRHSMQCILLVGLRNTSFRLSAAAADTSFMVATGHASSVIGGAATAQVQSDNLGVLDFRIAALDPVEATPLGSIELRKLLAESGLILEWSTS